LSDASPLTDAPPLTDNMSRITPVGIRLTYVGEPDPEVR